MDPFWDPFWAHLRTQCGPVWGSVLGSYLGHLLGGWPNPVFIVLGLAWPAPGAGVREFPPTESVLRNLEKAFQEDSDGNLLGERFLALTGASMFPIAVGAQSRVCACVSSCSRDRARRPGDDIGRSILAVGTNPAIHPIIDRRHCAWRWGGHCTGARARKCCTRIAKAISQIPY